ncbi:MAG: ATP-binding protein [Prochlorotrichaceae cyanobacterium]
MDFTSSLSLDTIATLLEQSTDGWLWIMSGTDQGPTITYANQRAADLLNDNLLGLSFTDFLDRYWDEGERSRVGTDWPPPEGGGVLRAHGLDYQIMTIEQGAIVVLRSPPHFSSPVEQLNLQLEQKVQQHTEQLEQAIAWEAMLKRITDRVRDSLDQDQILQQAVKELALALKASSCNAALYDLAQSTSTIYYEYARNIPASQGRVARMNDYPELYNQLLEAEYFQFCSITPSPVRGRVAMLACPIFDNEGVLGDLWLVNRCDYAFSEFEIRFVQQAANQCAIALRQAKLYEAAQAQVKELEKLNRLKDEFLSTVSHELRTPMANMKMAIRMLDIATQKIVEVGQEEVRQRIEHYLMILRKECEREIQLINDLLDLQRLEANAQSVEWEYITLQDWLPSHLQLFNDRIHSREQSLQLDIPEDLESLRTDSSSLERIVAELVNNACKYTPPGGVIHIKAYPQDGNLYLEVCNFGVEIAPEEQSKIFEKFYRIASNDPWKQGGTGLGLALVKGMMERLGGGISVTSGDQQTCFILQFSGGA